MYHKVLHIIFLVVVVNATSLFLTGCFDPIVVERETDPKLDIWHKELPTAPDEQVFAVGRNHLSIAAVINEIENANPDIQITDIEKLKSEIGFTSDGLLLPDAVSRLRTHRLSRLGEEVLIAIEAESIGKHRFGVPPYDLRAGAYIVNLYAIVAPLEENRSVTQLNVRVITGGSAFLFPLPVIVETVDELDPHAKAQKVLGQEIGKFIDKYYESKSVNVTIMWLSAEGIVRERQFEGCTGTWDEIKKCSEYKK